MAANAYSTPVVIPSHLRGGPVSQIAAASRVAERAPFEGRGCIFLDGEMITFQAGCRILPGDRALVILHDGSLAIRQVVEGADTPRAGLVYVEGERVGRGVLRVLDLVPAVGTVT